MARLGLISLVAVLSLLAFQPIFAQDETDETTETPETSATTIFVIIVNNKPVNLSVPTNLVEFVTQVATQIIETANTDPNTEVTLDIDECSTGVSDDCNHTIEKCVNTDGGFLCVCLEGFIRETTGGDCVTDLCFEADNKCETTKQCNNDETDPECECGPGFHLNVTTNGCEITTPCFPNLCPTNSRCHNNGHFECQCLAGYENTAEGSGTDANCEDINECDDNTDTCDGGSRASCTNTDGSFECACKDGYSGDGTTCTDVDECTAGTHNCDDQATCNNNEGSFECSCNAGYAGVGTAGNCEDIDECADETDNCDDEARATCTNIDGSFTCACNAGYAGDGVSCLDINECADNTDGCDDEMRATCTNTEGSHDCACKAGYTGDGITCTDVDECAANTDNCHVTLALCTDTDGSFTCACNTGYSGDGVNCDDIDECTADTDNCHDNAKCTNSDGSFTCACNAGYSGNGVDCEDVDECADGTDNCLDTLATCDNIDGSFRCECINGYSGDGVTCTDIDECATNTHDCHDTLATCSNTVGSHTCACNVGYSGDGVTCDDVDECAESSDNCHANADCTNTDGSFTCMCMDGYSGNGVTCEDIIECDESPPPDCGDFAFCVNNVGSFTCDCNEGFSGSHPACTDVDECAENTDNCHDDLAMCSNSIGTHTCECITGYSGDGVTCDDINECAVGTHNCDSNADCSNTIGSFDCDCRDGYSGDGKACADIDECEEDTDDCDDTLVVCHNNAGSFDCQCMDGYAGEGTTETCVDVDECANKSDNCTEDGAICTNTVGSFTCECESDHFGNGMIKCAPKSRSMVVTATGTQSSRRRRDTDNTAFEDAMEAVISELLADSTTVDVTVLDSEPDGAATTYTLLIATEPDRTDFLESALGRLEGRNIGGTVIGDIQYPVTASFTGSVPVADSVTCDALADFVNQNLTDSGAITDDTVVSCVGTPDVNSTFTVTVDGTLSGTFDLAAIMTSFSRVTAANLCDSTPCAPNGNCADSTGEVVCTCSQELYDTNIADPGKTCESPILDPVCGSESIKVGVRAAYFRRLGLDVDNTIHLVDQSCVGVVDVNAILQFTTEFDACGSISAHTADQLVYTNNITNVITNPDGSKVQRKAITIAFPFTCVYDRNFDTSDSDQEKPEVNVISAEVIVQSADGTGTLAVTVTVYTDSDFQKPLAADTSVAIGDPLFVKANHSAETAGTNFLKLTSCYVTPTNDPDDTSRHEAITDQCSVDTSYVTEISSGEAETASFKMFARSFDGFDQFFIHCEVEVCETDCSKDQTTCSSSGARRRRRRGAGGDAAFVLGPIATEDYAAATASTSITAVVVSAVAAVLLIVCAVLVVQRLRKRKALKHDMLHMQHTGFISPRETDYRTSSYENYPVISRRPEH